MIQPLKRLATK